MLVTGLSGEFRRCPDESIIRLLIMPGRPKNPPSHRLQLWAVTKRIVTAIPSAMRSPHTPNRPGSRPVSGRIPPSNSTIVKNPSRRFPAVLNPCTTSFLYRAEFFTLALYHSPILEAGYRIDRD